ncbi:alpha-amylase family glycosyl hydrolase [Clostridium sp. HCP1S3_B4]|uniref:alpha-amylase family glycosyl hydrolase n=1 Tax=unclassified Clostridium TaxID=2614128 RepID=UPI003F893349
MSKLTKKLMCLVASIMVSFTMISSSALAKNKLELSSDTESVEEAQVSNHGLPDSIDDGVILHAWNWSFNNIRKNMKEIAEAGYNTIQTSPAQACRLGETWKKADLEQTNDKPTWYYLYQPTYFTLGNDYLGTAEEFKAMCETAHKYGVKIIVDVVANHLADCGSEHKDKVDTELYDEARKCSGLDDPNRITGSDWKVRDKVTQGCCIGMPDIDTKSKTAQNKIGSYLQECVKNGADGFRFDAVKSIELPEKYERPGATSSDFWTTVMGMADSAASDEGKKLFYYGEALQGDEPGTNAVGYTNIMRITGSQYGFCLRQATGYVMWQEEVKGKDEIRGDGANRDPSVTNVALDMVQGSWSPDGLTAEWVKNPTSIPEGTQWSMDNISNDKYVSWVESHDLYANAGATRCMDTPRREVAWALMTARDKVVPLFFNRPVDTDFGSNANSPQGEAYKTMGERGSDDFASKNVVAVNRFHNAMVGQAEKISTAQGNGNGGDPKILVVNRGNKGTAIINTGRDSEFEVESSLPDGTYENQAESGGSFNVSGGRVSGKIPANGIIVLYTPEDINFDDVKDDDSDIKDDDSKKDDAKKDDEEAILKINSIKASKNEANVSDDITITVNATGTNLKYKLSEIVDNDEQDYTSFIKKNSFTWSSDEVGKHVLKVSVTDGQKTVTKNITINIVDPNVSDKELSVVLNSTSKTISLGDSISLSATASDYSGICKYLFKYKKSTDSWEDGHNISSGYTSANKVKWEAPEEAGKYDVIVYVKDSEGNTAESESVRYTIKESESKDDDTSDSSDSTLVLLISLTMMLSLMGMVKTYKNNN